MNILESKTWIIGVGLKLHGLVFEESWRVA
jgi:hypothetical protein